ncbi:hypothetical protein WA026_021377 [Henosepilachna vigintioctopunctata]|uniref:Regulator of G-protein signaling 7 n=1 Tax=Henosepilachna vigintioctopunctata TaxID=420089 RepID=A0AAW1TXM6_9CUCU
MEGLVRKMQDTENGGIMVRSQKIFLSSIPAAFMGYDIIEWLTYTFRTFDNDFPPAEAVHLANMICSYGYFFPVDSKNLTVKDDGTFFRFQSPYYWPWQKRPPDNVEYAIYLAKRTLRNKQRHQLEDYELEAYNNLKKNLANKWEFITMQAEEQVKLLKTEKKVDKIIADSQERAYWRVHRPPPGMVTSLEHCPVPSRSWNGQRMRKKTVEDCRREVDLLRRSLTRTRIKTSQAIESLIQYYDTYVEYDVLMSQTSQTSQSTHPTNPWVTDDVSFWLLNAPLVEVTTEKRIRKWALSMEDLVSDPTGLQEFTTYLRKEYSHENIRFWSAVNELRRSAQSQISIRVQLIFEEFLAPGAPCEINIDGKTMEKVHQEMRNPSRFTFDAAQEHVYTLLLKKDCYPRFIRSDHYKSLLANAIQQQISQKKRFFGFGQMKKKTSTSNAPSQNLLQQQASQGGCVAAVSAIAKRRGSDRSLSGSAHELAVSGVKDPKVPHSHSQSNLSDIPYRGDLANLPKGVPVAAVAPSPVKKPNMAVVAGASTSEDVCPWEAVPEPRSRRNSGQSESSSSDVSVAVAEITERLQRTNILTQQHTVDGSHQLVVHAAEMPRRASVSVPIAHGVDQVARRKVSSFEDNRSSARSTPPSVFIIPGDLDNKTQENICKTLRKSHSIAKTCSVTGTNAPIISVSSVADESTDDDARSTQERIDEIEDEPGARRVSSP